MCLRKCMADSARWIERMGTPVRPNPTVFARTCRSVRRATECVPDRQFHRPDCERGEESLCEPRPLGDPIRLAVMDTDRWRKHEDRRVRDRCHDAGRTGRGGTSPTIPLTLPRAFESLTGSNLTITMANTKSAIKAARKAVRLTTRNSGVKTRLKTLHKKLNAAIAAKDAAAIKGAASIYTSAMDKAVKSGVVHKNAASRAKAHVAKYLFAK